MSKVGLREGGIIRVPFNWMRKFLIESIYRRLSKSALQYARVPRNYQHRFQLSRSPKLPSGPVLLTST